MSERERERGEIKPRKRQIRIKACSVDNLKSNKNEDQKQTKPKQNKEQLLEAKQPLHVAEARQIFATFQNIC